MSNSVSLTRGEKSFKMKGFEKLTGKKTDKPTLKSKIFSSLFHEVVISRTNASKT